jgi:hypothetical protein
MTRVYVYRYMICLLVMYICTYAQIQKHKVSRGSMHPCPHAPTTEREEKKRKRKSINKIKKKHKNVSDLSFVWPSKRKSYEKKNKRENEQAKIHSETQRDTYTKCAESYKSLCTNKKSATMNKQNNVKSIEMYKQRRANLPSCWQEGCCKRTAYCMSVICERKTRQIQQRRAKRMETNMKQWRKNSAIRSACKKRREDSIGEGKQSIH